MPRSGQRLSALISAVLLVLASTPALAVQLDRDAFRWTDEYGSAPFKDGQVLPGRLIVRFEQGAQPLDLGLVDLVIGNQV